MDLRQGGSRRGERITHLPLVGFDFRVDATQIGEELLGEIAGGQALVAVVGLILPQCCRRFVGGQSERGSTGGRRSDNSRRIVV